nr:A24 family peptidase [Secundilactobacillus malefermentans]
MLFIFGSAMSSFIYATVDRLSRQESIVFPPSHCVACLKKLTPLELTPIFGYLYCHGRCRSCYNPIGFRSFLIEFSGGVISSAMITFPFSLANLFLTSSMFLLLALSLFDCDSMMVPTWLLAILFINSSLYNLFTSFQLGLFLALLIAWLIFQPFGKYISQMGGADIDIMFIIFWIDGLTLTTSIILIACLSALVHFKFYSTNPKIPFIPHLTASYILFNIFLH